MRLCMFTPRELALERGWPGRIEGDWVVQLAAQTLEAFFSGGGKAREHNIYPLSDVTLRAPVLRPPSVRLFRDATTFEFGNTASIFGPDDQVHAPAPAAARFRVAAVVGGEERIVGYTLVNDWKAPSLAPPKDSDFATSIGPWIETAHEPEFDFAGARNVAARNTRLRAGDVLVAPPFAISVPEASVDGLGTLRASTSAAPPAS
ncbi:MAG: hypothetical protein ACJ76U_17270 [Gaiellaceae bacterium]